MGWAKGEQVTLTLSELNREWTRINANGEEGRDLPRRAPRKEDQNLTTEVTGNTELSVRMDLPPEGTRGTKTGG